MEFLAPHSSFLLVDLEPSSRKRHSRRHDAVNDDHLAPRQQCLESGGKPVRKDHEVGGRHHRGEHERNRPRSRTARTPHRDREQHPPHDEGKEVYEHSAQRHERMQADDVKGATPKENVRNGVQRLKGSSPRPPESDECARGRRRRREADPHAEQQTVAEHGRKNSRQRRSLKRTPDERNQRLP
jgi:hypothetical protein